MNRPCPRALITSGAVALAAAGFSPARGQTPYVAPYGGAVYASPYPVYQGRTWSYQQPWAGPTRWVPQPGTYSPWSYSRPGTSGGSRRRRDPSWPTGRGVRVAKPWVPR